MKIKHCRELKNGKRHVLVELDASETLLTFDKDGCYRLDRQLDDVVPGHAITKAIRVHWCSVTHEWVS